MDDEEKRAWRRLFAVLAAVIVTLTTSFVVAFRYPDETTARRWINHPWEMGLVALMAAACMAFAYWPDRDRGKCHGCGLKAPREPITNGWRVARGSIKVCPDCLLGEVQSWWPRSWSAHR